MITIDTEKLHENWRNLSQTINPTNLQLIETRYAEQVYKTKLFDQTLPTPDFYTLCQVLDLTDVVFEKSDTFTKLATFYQDSAFDKCQPSIMRFAKTTNRRHMATIPDEVAFRAGLGRIKPSYDTWKAIALETWNHTETEPPTPTNVQKVETKNAMMAYKTAMVDWYYNKPFYVTAPNQTVIDVYIECRSGFHNIAVFYSTDLFEMCKRRLVSLAKKRDGKLVVVAQSHTEYVMFGSKICKKSEGSESMKSEGSESMKSEGSESMKSEGSESMKSEGSESMKSEGSESMKHGDTHKPPKQPNKQIKRKPKTTHKPLTQLQQSVAFVTQPRKLHGW